MEYKILKTAEEHRAALEIVEWLMAMDPPLDTPNSDQLKLWALLIEDYEKRHFKFEIPDLPSAARFRVEESEHTLQLSGRALVHIVQCVNQVIDQLQDLPRDKTVPEDEVRFEQLRNVADEVANAYDFARLSNPGLPPYEQLNQTKMRRTLTTEEERLNGLMQRIIRTAISEDGNQGTFSAKGHLDAVGLARRGLGRVDGNDTVITPVRSPINP